MNDKMTLDKERENCPCRKAIINPFDAMMMVVVRRLFIIRTIRSLITFPNKVCTCSPFLIDYLFILWTIPREWVNSWSNVTC